MSESLVVFWFRRDLRLHDNVGLNAALNSGKLVLPIFIFDDQILKNIDQDDARLNFIYDQLQKINDQLVNYGSALEILKGNPVDVWKDITDKYRVTQVYFNHDYEPYAIQRDYEVEVLLCSKSIGVHAFKDHVIFEKDEVVKPDRFPYTVYTPYKNKWLEKFETIKEELQEKKTHTKTNYLCRISIFPSREELGIKNSAIRVPEFDLTKIKNYKKYRDFPFPDNTSHVGPHLRFGTISVRELALRAIQIDEVYLSEIIWRDFFIQILYHFPYVTEWSFKKQYEFIRWENRTDHFEKWCSGETGYPIVDAGMRQLNATGTMHNRVRMVCASFLVKHLLIDWRWGEAYFAEKLLDFELASNNGNWQWAAGCGCDATPYFRVFNPSIQQERFDPELNYIRTWIPGYESSNYIKPIVEHNFARERAIQRFKDGLHEAGMNNQN